MISYAFIQAKQALDLSKHAYETLNNQLLEELPILYDNSCQILLICLTEYLRAHYRLMQQTRINIQIVLNQVRIFENHFFFFLIFESIDSGTIELERNS